MLRTRKKWPLGTPVRVDLDELEPFVLLGGDGRVLRAKSRSDPAIKEDNDLEPRRYRGLRRSERFSRERLEFGGRELGAYREEFDVSLEVNGYAIARWRAGVEFEVVPDEEAVPPVATPEIARDLRRSLEIEESVQQEYVSYWVRWWWAWYDDPVIRESGVVMEILVDGRVVGTTDYGSVVVRWGSRDEPWEGEVYSGDVTPVKFAREHVRVRIRGDRAKTIERTQADVYWGGSVEVSLAGLLDEDERLQFGRRAAVWP